MPRYFFRTVDGAAGPESIDLPDDRAAKEAAIRLASTMMRDQLHTLFDVGDFRLEVTDDRELVLCAVIVLLHNAPAMG